MEPLRFFALLFLFLRGINMDSHPSIKDDSYATGFCDFENYWGEELSKVEIKHFISGILFHTEKKVVSVVLHNVADRKKIENVLMFYHTNGSLDHYDFWKIKITTKSGKVYTSKDRFYCSLSESDNNKAILGVNGDEETLYVAFPSSSSCSTSLKLI